jgi:hypothetical protein
MNTADTDDVDGSGDHGNNAGGDNNDSDSSTPVVVFATPVVLPEQDGGNEVDGAGDTRTSGAGVDDATAATIDGWSLQLGMALLLGIALGTQVLFLLVGYVAPRALLRLLGNLVPLSPDVAALCYAGYGRRHGSYRDPEDGGALVIALMLATRLVAPPAMYIWRHQTCAPCLIDVATSDRPARRADGGRWCHCCSGCRGPPGLGCLCRCCRRLSLLQILGICLALVWLVTWLVEAGWLRLSQLSHALVFVLGMLFREALYRCGR